MSNTQPIAASPSNNSHCPADEQVLGQYIPLLYHYNMLQDVDRVGAFREAINLTVHPGMHVVELGGGTGILSSFAAHRGARVTCVERNPELVDVCRQFLTLNGLANRVEVIQADASEFTPPTRVDVVICEMLHVGLLREKQASVIERFKSNYRAAFASRGVDRTHGMPVFLPEVSMLMVQPVQQCFDFHGYQAPVPLFQAPVEDQPRTVALGELQSYANIDYHESIPQRFDVLQTFCIRETGSLNAVRLVTQNVLTVDEPAQRAISWPNQCLVIPLAYPRQVFSGDVIEVRFAYDAGAAVEELSDSLEVG